MGVPELFCFCPFFGTVFPVCATFVVVVIPAHCVGVHWYVWLWLGEEGYDFPFCFTASVVVFCEDVCTVDDDFDVGGGRFCAFDESAGDWFFAFSARFGFFFYLVLVLWGDFCDGGVEVCWVGYCDEEGVPVD